MFGQVYGTGTGITGAIQDAPEVVPDQESAGFWQEVDRFKAKADEAYNLWQKLRAKRQAAASNPELQAEYADVMAGAEDIQSKVSDVERVVNAAKSTVGGWFSLDGLGGLGVYQFAIVAIAAAIAWIGTWLAKAYVVDRKLTAVETLIAGGTDPDTAGDIVAGKPDPGPFGDLFGNVGTGIAVAGVAAVVLYFFFEKKRGF